MPVLIVIDTISIAEAILKLIFPMTILFILIFFLVFESMCNIFAELTQFGDRQFYQVKNILHEFFKFNTLNFLFEQRIGGTHQHLKNLTGNGVDQFMNFFLDMFI